jgi:hypothetical protein
MEYKMRITLLLSTLAISLIGVTPSSAQATNFGPDYSYPQGYEELGPARPTYRPFGPSDYGYYQGRVGADRVQAPRAEHRVPLRTIKSINEFR